MAITRYADIASRISLLGFDRAQTQLTGFQTGLVTFATKAEMAGKAMLKMGGLMAAGLGIITKVGMDYEHQMAQVRIETGQNAEEFAKTSLSARKTATDLGIAARDVGKSYLAIADAGIKEVSVMDAIARVSLKLAKVENTELGPATEMIISTMKRFNMVVGKEAADRVGNVFAAAVVDSRATLEKLGTSMETVGVQANALGYSLEDTVAILEALYDKGFDASQAGTMLRMAMIRMLDPAGETQKAMDKLGLTFIDASGNMKKMPVIMEEMSRALEGYTDTEKAAILTTIFGARAVSGMLALLSLAPGTLKKYQDGLKDTTRLEKMWQITSEETRQKLAILKVATQELAISIFTTLKPSIDRAVVSLTEFIKRWDELSPRLKEAIAHTLKWGVVVGVGGGAALIMANQVALLGVNLTVLIPKVIAFTKAMTLAKLAMYGEIAVIAAGVAVTGKAIWEGAKMVEAKIEEKKALKGAAEMHEKFNENMEEHLAIVKKAAKYKVEDLCGDPKKVKDIQRAISVLTVLVRDHNKEIADAAKGQLADMKNVLESHKRLGGCVEELTDKQIDSAKKVGRISEEEMKRRVDLARDIVRERSSIEDELLGKIKDIEEEKARVRSEIADREEDRVVAIAKSQQLATGEAVGYWDEVNELAEYGKRWGIENAERTLEGKSDTLKEWISQNEAAQFALQKVGLLGGDVEREKMEERLKVLDKEKSETTTLMEIRLKALDEIVAKEQLINEIIAARTALIGPGGKIVPSFYQENKIDLKVDADAEKIGEEVKEAVVEAVDENTKKWMGVIEEMNRAAQARGE